MPTSDDSGPLGAKRPGVYKWRSLVGSDNLVSRKINLVLPRWLAQQLEDQAEATQSRIEDVIVKRLAQSAGTAPAPPSSV
jgi:hypothetical protein